MRYIGLDNAYNKKAVARCKNSILYKNYCYLSQYMNNNNLK